MNWLRIAAYVALLSVFPSLYFLGVHNTDAKWKKLHAQQQKEYSLQLEGVKKEAKAREEGASLQIEILTKASEASNEEFKRKLASVERNAATGVRNSSNRAEVYRSQARASEAERESLAAHCASLDRHLVEGKQVATVLRLTLEQREDELRELGTVLKIIENKYE